LLDLKCGCKKEKDAYKLVSLWVGFAKSTQANRGAMDAVATGELCLNP
jgi:hypothetical protein